MRTYSRPLYIVGAVLATLGSFLPWEVEGDAIPYWKYGIGVYLDSFTYWLRGLHAFPLDDNGGLLVVGLSVFIVMLVFYTPSFIKRPQVWGLVCTATLALLVGYHVSNLLLRRFELHNVFWAPSIQIGLVMAALGTLLMLYAGISDYRKHENASRKM